MKIKISCILICLLSLTNITNSISPKCIISKMNKRNRIVPYDYTFLAQVLLQDKLICSATVIHNCWLLSAASCFDLTPNWYAYEIRVGVIGMEETYTTHPVLQVFIEDNYHHGSNEHNIALIQVDYMDNINYLSSINLVSARMNLHEPVDCTILGYNLQNSIQLGEIKMKVANYTDCYDKMNQLYLNRKERRYKPNTIGKNNFCLTSAGDRNETFCEATIGGPVLCSSNEHLRGVVVDFPLNKHCNDIGPIPVIDISSESEWVQDAILNLNKKASFRAVAVTSSSHLVYISVNHYHLMMFSVLILYYIYQLYQ